MADDSAAPDRGQGDHDRAAAAPSLEAQQQQQQQQSSSSSSSPAAAAVRDASITASRSGSHGRAVPPPPSPPRTVPAGHRRRSWGLVKVGLTLVSLVASFVLLFLAIALAVREHHKWPPVVFWTGPLAIVLGMWDVAELLCVCTRTSRRGIHPGAHIALDFVLCLVLGVCILLTAAVLSQAQDVQRDCRRRPHHSHPPAADGDDGQPAFQPSRRYYDHGGSSHGWYGHGGYGHGDFDHFHRFGCDFREFHALRGGVFESSLEASLALLAALTIIRVTLLARAAVESYQRSQLKSGFEGRDNGELPGAIALMPTSSRELAADENKPVAQQPAQATLDGYYGPGLNGPARPRNSSGANLT
ncbi:hypothetical protein F4780DRAFT_572827 [Xylariomycetidae sp. FL0641]|nr:hypothetical protein F4780DRAFT_572827 [Xylariomycetidae sp. FL0641]